MVDLDNDSSENGLKGLRSERYKESGWGQLCGRTEGCLKPDKGTTRGEPEPADTNGSPAAASLLRFY